MIHELVGADDTTRLKEQQLLAEQLAELIAQLEATEVYQMELEAEADAA
jgi:hypothetical protein